VTSSDHVQHKQQTKNMEYGKHRWQHNIIRYCLSILTDIRLQQKEQCAKIMVEIVCIVTRHNLSNCIFQVAPYASTSNTWFQLYWAYTSLPLNSVSIVVFFAGLTLLSNPLCFPWAAHPSECPFLEEGSVILMTDKTDRQTERQTGRTDHTMYRHL